MLSMSAVYLNVNNLGLWVQYVLQDESLNSLVMVCVQTGVVISFFFWAAVTTKIGKKKVYYLGGIVWSVGYVALFIIPPAPYTWWQLTLLLVACFVRGFGTL